MGTLREGVVAIVPGGVPRWRGDKRQVHPAGPKPSLGRSKVNRRSWLEDGRQREGVVWGSKLNEGTNWVVPAQGHSLSSNASCRSRKPSNSQTFIFRAKGARAEVPGPWSAEQPTAPGKGRGAGGRRRARGVSGRASGTPQLEDSVS